jgi:hypothetical protein
MGCTPEDIERALREDLGAECEALGRLDERMVETLAGPLPAALGRVRGVEPPATLDARLEKLLRTVPLAPPRRPRPRAWRWAYAGAAAAAAALIAATIWWRGGTVEVHEAPSSRPLVFAPVGPPPPRTPQADAPVGIAEVIGGDPVELLLVHECERRLEAERRAARSAPPDRPTPPPIWRLARELRDEPTRRAAAFALARRGTRRATELLAAQLADPHGALVALDAAAAHVSPGNVSVLLAALERRPEVRRAAVAHLEDIAGVRLGQSPARWRRWWSYSEHRKLARGGRGVAR